MAGSGKVPNSRTSAKTDSVSDVGTTSESVRGQLAGKRSHWNHRGRKIGVPSRESSTDSDSDTSDTPAETVASMPLTAKENPVPQSLPKTLDSPPLSVGIRRKTRQIARRSGPKYSRTPDPASNSEPLSRSALPYERRWTVAATKAHKRQKMDQDNCSRVENKSSSSPSWKASLYENSRPTTPNEPDQDDADETMVDVNEEVREGGEGDDEREGGDELEGDNELEEGPGGEGEINGEDSDKGEGNEEEDSNEGERKGTEEPQLAATTTGRAQPRVNHSQPTRIVPVPRNKAKEPSSVPKKSPNASAPPPSQPFPMSSPDPIPLIDPSVDLSAQGGVPSYGPESDMSALSESDLPSISELLSQSRVGKGKGKEKDRSRFPLKTLKRTDQGVDKLVNKGGPIPTPKVTLKVPVCKDEPDVQPKYKGKRKRTADASSDIIEIEHEHFPSKIQDPTTSPTPPPRKKLVKRPRPSSRPAAQKHEQFWILDGNTVLEAGGVLFRLHRSRLVDLSTLFAEVFGGDGGIGDKFRNEVDMVEDGEGGLIYQLKKVAPGDLAALLEYDRDPTQFHFSKPTRSTLASILRAATSLQFTRYRAVAMKFLEAEWLPLLDDITEEYKPGAVEVAVLGRRWGIPGVLKRAFYEMARGSGCGLGDGDDEEGMDVDEESEGGRDMKGSISREEISRSDERLIGRMREHLVSAWAQDAACLDPSFTCPFQVRDGSGKATQSSQTPQDGNPAESPAYPVASSSSTASAVHSLPKCTSVDAKREAWDRLVHNSGVYKDFLFDPISGLQELLKIDWEAEGWCKECIRMRKEAWSRARQRLWDMVGLWMRVNE